MKKRIYLTVLLILFSVTSLNSYAFKINPNSEYKLNHNQYEKVGITKTIRNGTLGFIENPSPIHENFVVQSLQKYSPNFEQKLLNEIVRGVRWNDDPQSTLESSKADFGVNYLHSSSKKVRCKIDAKYDYQYRTHYGDLQFLHAMASKKNNCETNETSDETLKNIMMWLEFTYKVSAGTISKDWRLRSVHKLEHFESGNIFSKKISDNGNKYKCELNPDGSIKSCAEVETLFTFLCTRKFKPIPDCKEYGNIDSETIMNIALGSALHVLQDSMSDSHVARVDRYPELCSRVLRKKGVIKYYSYNDQNDDLHEQADLNLCDVKNTNGELGIVDIGYKFISWSLTDRKNKSDSWEKSVKPYLLEEVFAPGSCIDECYIDKYDKKVKL